MDAWQYEPARTLNEPLAERLRHFPREPEMMMYGARLAAALATRMALHTYHRLHIVGRENLPQRQSFVLVANHASHLDTLAIQAALPLRQVHRIFAAAAQDYFFANLPWAALAVVVVNALPFHRQAHVRQSLRVCQTLLDDPGNVLLLFPEGTRSPDGRLQPFRPGIGLLLAGSPHPVVPCHLAGTHRALPKGAFLPRPRGIRLTIGPPRSYRELSAGKESATWISADLHDAVARLKSSCAAPCSVASSLVSERTAHEPR